MSKLRRQLEPEVMDDEGEALSYDAMGHDAVNERFVRDFLALGPDLGDTLDVGTGTARIPIELLRQAPHARVLGVDLARSMLDVGRRNVEQAGLSASISLEQVDAKGMPFAAGRFRAVMSNSIIHHIPEPARSFVEMLRVLAPGGTLFVRDLARPDDDDAVARLVGLYTAGETAEQRGLFEASLRAALTVDELRALLAPLGLPASCVSMTSDRHWTVAWRAA